MRQLAAIVLACLAAVCTAAPARAGEWLLGVYDHDAPYIGRLVGIGEKTPEQGTVDVQVGWRSDKLANWPWWTFGPQFHAIADINTAGKTDFVAAGLSWKIDLDAQKSWYVRPGLGLAYQDGYAHLPPYSGDGLTPAQIASSLALRREYIEFGSKILFEPELALGYRLNAHASIEASYTHLSHGQILAHGINQGLDDVGLRIAYRF